MKTVDVLIARIYITEASNLLNKIVDYLSREVKIRGISTFRAIQGFSAAGSHTASFLDLSLDLPLVIEFFDDDRDKVEKALTHLTTVVKSEHIVLWEAKAVI
jgi:PII-like signaling protein